MRVLAIAHGLNKLTGKGPTPGCGIGQFKGEPLGNGRVIGGRTGIGPGGQGLAQGKRGGAALLQGCDHLLQVGMLGADRHIAVVLGRRADHGWPANVDILDAGCKIAARRHGLLKRIKGHINDIDGANTVLGHGLGVMFGVADAQQAPMDHRVQGLDPTVHHLRETRQVGHVLDSQACRRDGRLGAAGGNQLHPHPRKRPGGLHQSGLVGHRQKGADRFDGVGGGGEVGGGGHGGLLAGR